MISQFFIVSLRGDLIIFKDYRSELPKDTPEKFFKYLMLSNFQAAPFFNLSGINYVHIKEEGIYIALTSSRNFSSSFAISAISRISQVIKDFCGTLNEDSVRSNFVLIYELLDEVLDFGYLQTTNNSAIKNYVYENAAMLNAEPKFSLPLEILKLKTKSSGASTRPISVSIENDRDQNNELFVDIVEAVSFLFDSNGDIVRSSIDGKLIIKSYLKGDPEIHLGLSRDLSIASRSDADNNSSSSNNYFSGSSFSSNSTAVLLDDINFHPTLNIELFDRDRTLSYKPMDGELVVLSYRQSSRPVIPPFRVKVSYDHLSNSMADVVVKLLPTYPSDVSASNITLSFFLPPNLQSVSFTTIGDDVFDDEDKEEEESFAEFQKQHNKVIWHIKKVAGNSEMILRTKMNFASGELDDVPCLVYSPIEMDFEIPMHLCTNLKIRHLKILERGDKYEPDRWVRYLTQCRSYVFRTA